jgi:tRNA-dihydrouridine synthase B
MKNKKLPCKNRIFLAPMEEVNDIAFRLLCKKAGCGLTYTGLTSPLTQQKLDLQDRPALQLFSNNTKGIMEFIKKHNSKVSLWDFNLGCPSKLAKKHGFGSYLTDLKKIEEIIKTIRQSTEKPFTIKIRKSPLSFKILEIAEKYCDAIGVHARTRQQGYSGTPDLDFALKIKSLSKIPVIYSGNVNEKNYKELLKKFDYLMIGREGIGHPEIFAKITKTKFERSFKDYLKLAKKYRLPFRQIKFQAMNFTKGLRNSRKLRLELFKIKDLGEFEKIIQKHKIKNN